MIAAHEVKVVLVEHLEGEQKRDVLDVLLATVDIVAEEDVVALGRESAAVEDAHQIGVLAVNVVAQKSARAPAWGYGRCTVGRTSTSDG